MSTVRLRVVEAIAAALATATGIKTHRNLDYAKEERNLPVLAVNSGADRPDNEYSPIGLLDQEMEIEISILVARSADPEAATDTCEAQIHALLSSATAFGGIGVTVKRIGGAWAFDLGDCVARHLGYRVHYRSSYADLESQ